MQIGGDRFTATLAVGSMIQGVVEMSGELKVLHCIGALSGLNESNER